MHQRVIEHFKKVDPVLYSVLDKIDSLKPLTKSNNYFSDLCETIINQQLSEKVGTVIFNRFKKLFPKGKITAEKLLKLKDEEIRKIGTSGKKAKFIKELAKKIHAKEVNLERLEQLENEEVVAELTKLKGIGQWTAEMFLMFSLGREDVFSYGDLGLRRAMQKLYKLPKEPKKAEAEEISIKWFPYRTYAARILWRSLEV